MPEVWGRIIQAEPGTGESEVDMCSLIETQNEILSSMSLDRQQSPSVRNTKTTSGSKGLVLSTHQTEFEVSCVPANSLQVEHPTAYIHKHFQATLL
jgi:hypothetical protein